MAAVKVLEYPRSLSLKKSLVNSLNFSSSFLGTDKNHFHCTIHFPLTSHFQKVGLIFIINVSSNLKIYC